MVSAGRPGSGYVHQLKCSTKLKYKKGIRDAYIAFGNSHNDELFSHFLIKRSSEFWKTRQSKFRNRNVARNITIDGCANDHDIAICKQICIPFASVYQQAGVSNSRTHFESSKPALWSRRHFPWDSFTPKKHYKTAIQSDCAA